MRPAHSVDSEGRWSRLGCDPRPSKERHDPARRVARFYFHDRMDKPGNERPFYGQRCFLATMLIIAAASRDLWISRLERLHAYQVAAAKTVPRRRGGFMGGIAAADSAPSSQSCYSARRARRRRALLPPASPRSTQVSSGCHGNGSAKFGGGDYDCYRALLGGIFQLRPQFLREVIG